MKNLGLALQLKYPDATNGVDYEVVDRKDGKGPVITKWTFDDPRPENQGDVNRIINEHVDRRVDLDARREPDYPNLEERIAALEEKAGGTPATERIKAAKNRVRDRVGGPNG